MSDQKLCVVCGADCAGKPRVKDPSGRYYCKACYDVKAGEAASVGKAPRTSARAVADVPGDVQGDGLADLAGLASLAAATPAMPTLAALPTAPGGSASRRSGRSVGTAGPLDYVINPGRWIQGVTGSSKSLLLGGGATFLVALLLAWGELPELLWRFRATSSQLGDDVAAYTDGWVFAIAMYGVLTLVGAILYWLIGPLWLKVRVGWSGGSCTREAARAALFASALPACVLMSLSATLVVLVFRGPTDVRFFLSDYYRVAFPLLAALLLILGSVQVWHMAWRGFGAKAIPSALLVLGLPVLVSVFGLAQAFGMRGMTSESGSGASPPQVVGRAPIDAPKPNAPNEVQHRPHPRTPVRFTYMNNWTIRPDHARGTESAGVEVRSNGGSLVYIQRFTKEESKGNPAGLLDGWLKGMLRDGLKGAQLVKVADLTEFAGRAAKGYQFDGKTRGVEMGLGKPTAYLLLLSEMVSPDQSVVIVTIVIPEADRSQAMPVVEKIVSTIVVEPQR